MQPGPALITKIILESVALDASPNQLVDIIADIILERKWETSRSIAREKAERWHDQTHTRIRNEINELKELGRPTRITFNSSSDYIVQGSCFIEPQDSIELENSKLRRLRSVEYIQNFEQITPTQFEKLCGKVIALLGVENPHVTRQASDEGIDFYGRLSLESIFFPQDLSPTIQKQLSIWIVGQAKHYKRIQSSTNEIRDLMGAITLGKARAFGSKTTPFPDLRIRVGDPVFALFITTGTLSSNVWRLLRKSGIIGMDGEMVAAFLADREAGLGDDEDSLNTENFIRWLEKT